MDQDKLLEGIIIGIFGGLFSGIGIWLLDRLGKLRDFTKDENSIVTFLTKHINETDFIFNTTYRISSEVNLTESRVNEICSRSTKIRRNQKNKETWTIR